MRNKSQLDPIVERSNALDLEDFTKQLLGRAEIEHAQVKITERIGRACKLELLFSNVLKTYNKHTFENCFSLIAESSADDYKASEIKWSPAKKRKEMLLPDLRYLIMYDASESAAESLPATSPRAADAHVLGFVSFMLTYEDGLEVIYVYEIHLCKDVRGQGVGSTLMSIVEGVGRTAGVEKCMLTVFKSNEKAVKWYEHCGYSVDDFSPGPRVLRNGTVKLPSYLILSKSLKSTCPTQAD